MKQQYEELGNGAVPSADERPSRLDRAQAVLEHFADKGVNPDMRAVDRFLSILGSSWRREPLLEGQSDITPALIRQWPRSLDLITDGSYLDTYEEVSGGSLRVSPRGIEIKPGAPGILSVLELTTALAIERASSPELADADTRVGGAPGIDETSSEQVVKRLGELPLDEEAVKFMQAIYPSVLRVIVYSQYRRGYLADKLGLSPHTITTYITQARNAGGFASSEDLKDFLERKGMLLDMGEE